jgi:hypothetical protein
VTGTILIIGGQFGNQGAYLMLRAAADEVRRRFGAAPVVDFGLGTAAQRAKAGVGTLWTPRVYRPKKRATLLRTPKKLTRFSPFALPADVTGVLDISGFRYGDQWAHLPLDKYSAYLAYWAQLGVPVYMMPQAFGPFQKTAEASRPALVSARMVIARDPDSELHARELLGADNEAVVRYGDFTDSIKGYVPSSVAHLAQRVPVVANYNIADRDGREGYIDTLVGIASQVLANGDRPYGLVHGGARDREVLRAVAARLSDFPIVEGLDGEVQKGLIGTAPYIVAGRFHAIVSALSQGVPAVIHGWSHKYRWLADDYGVEGLMAPAVGEIAANLSAVNAARNDDKLRAVVQENASKRAGETEAMWTAVHEDYCKVLADGLKHLPTSGTNRAAARK